MLSLLLLLFGLSGLRTHYDPGQPGLQITVPEKIGSNAKEDFVSQVFYNLLIEGKTYTVNLTQKNFLPHNFRVYGYNYSEIMQPLIQKFKNLCNYQGHIEGFPNSVVTISTCSGLRGLIQFENISYGIEPLETSSGFEHVIYPVKNKNASYSLYTKMDNEPSQLSHKIPRVKLQLDNTTSYTWYLEIHVVVEKNLYDHMGADPAAVTQKVFQVIGFVSAMFTSFNITLILSSLELWIDDNKISITGEANELLHRFLNWKKSYLVLRPHDVAFLLVYREKSRYVGATLKGKMCDGKNAGGVALYSRTISLESFAVIIAQLLSLSMGIAFDDVNKCQCSGAACIMNPEAVGVRIFSNCSMEDFIRFISKPNSRCLQNQPHLDPSYKTSLCGNKHVEDGEQCDCGRVEECRRDPCCEYKTCRFKGNAVCAHGSCCTQCKLREKGEICRLSEDECDLTEYCNGSSNFCPENFYLHDGYRCNMNQWVCMEGKCRDGTRLCEEIYGKGTLYGSQACFEEINSRSDQFGNCGLSPGGFIPCTFNNLRCGKLMCIYTNKFPFSKEDAAVLYAGVEGDICISLYYPSRHKNYSHMWVPSGTICGDNKICMESMCVEDNLLPIECSSRKCNFQGRCNNRRNCHCEDRYLPPDCLTISNTWPGGSVDSGNFPPDPHGTSWNISMLLGGRANIRAYFEVERSRVIHERSFLTKTICQIEIRYIENVLPSKTIKWSIISPVILSIILCALIIVFIQVTPLRKKCRPAKSTSDEQQESEDVSQE